MFKTKLLPKDAALVDRLRAHAAKRVEDQAQMHNGFRVSIDRAEAEELDQILDEAADEIERLAQAIQPTPAASRDL